MGLLGSACGGGAEKNDAGLEASPGIVRETCADNPLLAGCAPPRPAPTPSESEPRPPRPGAAEPAPSEAELARAAAENVLRANCGQCHGPALTPAAARAGMNYIDDIDALVDNGKIIPLDSARSAVVRRMREGSMPPLGSGGPRPSERDIDAVAEFIDNPVFWPEYRPAPSCQDQRLTFDELYRQVLVDLRREERDDRAFLRYVTLTNRYNAGVCADALDRERFALGKLVNMLSTRARVVVPQPIDRDRLIYRVDLRDYDWDRDVVVEGESFRDGWEAIIAASPYAVPFVGDQADDLRADTLTNVPLINADALLDAAAVGELYYALIGVDVNEPLSAFIRDQLGIDVEENLADGQVVRAGTSRSQISRQDRVLERHEIELRRGVYWQSFDFEAGAANDSIFTNPFGFNQGGTEAIFTLLNGMLGFIIADRDDAIVAESNILLDTFQDDFTARTSVSCSSCHAQGFNPVVDEVGPFVRANRIQFRRDELEAVEEIYPGATAFARIIEQDSLGFVDTLRRANLPTTGADPVGATYVRFNADVDLATAAGDLGVTPDELRRELNLLDPSLAVLRDIGVDRDVFHAVFEESLCILQSVSNNQPDPERCSEVLGR
jgi:mono/diheme cytochrome c family protein